LCGGQPTGMARCSIGCRGRPHLKGLRGGQNSQALPLLAERERERASSRHTSEKTKTEVSSDTYPLRGKANRACGEAPRAPVSVGTAEGCPAAGFGVVSASDARGAKGATCPGVVTTVEGPAPCTAGADTSSWGGMRFGLTPRSHPHHLDQGVKYPLGLPPLLGPGPWCPGPRHWWCQPTWRLARRPLAQPRVRAEAKSGRHVIVFIIIIIIVVVVRRLWRRLQREPIPRLPPMTLLQGFPSSHPLASPGLFRVLFLLFLLCGEPTHDSVCHVLRDRWPGDFKTPQPLRTNKNPNSKSQRRRKLGAKQKKDRTLTRDTYPRSGRIAGWLRAPASSLPTVPATRLRRSSAEREVEDIREPSKSTPGFIFESRNCRSAKGSTLR
jgi:hypothetical protein